MSIGVGPRGPALMHEAWPAMVEEHVMEHPAPEHAGPADLPATWASEAARSPRPCPPDIETRVTNLARMMAAAERTSLELLRCVAQFDAPPAGVASPAVLAARRCHWLIQEAYLCGAIELAATLDIPDHALPA